MSMFIVFVLSKTSCDKEPPENIRSEWKLMNRIEQWFSLRKRKAVSLVYVCVGQRDRKDTVGVDHLGVLKL